MGNVANPSVVLEMGELKAAARALGLEIAALEIQKTQDIVPAFEALKGRADALYVVVDALVAANWIRINTLALGARLPTMSGSQGYVEMGGLISYGPNGPALFRRAADYVDKILRGAKPGDLPVEQPTKFDLVINLVTARGLGLNDPGIATRPRRRGDRMRRREFITLIGGAGVVLPLAARGQEGGGMRRIGFLGTTTAPAWTSWTGAFVQRLRELGWIEGRTATIEYRWAESRPERFVEIAAEFARLKVDVIFTAGSQSTLAARQATSEVPIVFALAHNPVSSGLVASLARPGGNVTGLSTQGTDTVGKRLGLMGELVPSFAVGRSCSMQAFPTR